MYSDTYKSFLGCLIPVSKNKIHENKKQCENVLPNTFSKKWFWKQPLFKENQNDISFCSLFSFLLFCFQFKGKKNHWNIVCVWIPLILLKTEKHCSKIIFKCVNSTVEPIFNESFVEKRSLWVPWTVHRTYWKSYHSHITCS